MWRWVEKEVAPDSNGMLCLSIPKDVLEATIAQLPEDKYLLSYWCWGERSPLI